MMDPQTELGEVTCPLLMVTAAHRYCLGRSTGIVAACVDWCCQNWGQFDRNTKFTILRDTIEALAKGDAGMDMDARDWRRLIAYAWPTLDGERRALVRHAVRHLGEAALKEIPKEAT